MQVQSITTAKINLTSDDMREALADYITKNGFDISAESIPDDIVNDIAISVEIVAEGEPKKAAPSRSRAKPKAAEPKPVEPKVEPVKAKAADPFEEEVETSVPAADVEAYRKKREEELSLAKAEAAAKEIVDDVFADEPEVVAEPAAPAEAHHADSLDDDDDFVVADPKPVTKAASTSIFDDPEITTVTTTAQPAKPKATVNLDNIFD